MTGADQVILFIDIRMIYDPENSKIEAMTKNLAGMTSDYESLLQSHALIHGELFNRVQLNIGGGSDHELTTEELLAKTTNESLSKALIEKEFDAGRTTSSLVRVSCLRFYRASGPEPIPLHGPVILPITAMFHQLSPVCSWAAHPNSCWPTPLTWSR